MIVLQYPVAFAEEPSASLNGTGRRWPGAPPRTTPLGRLSTGDAVAGLRSAFLFTGAQTLIGSLHEVPDEQTRQLMQSFYTGLRERRGKLASLNAARLELIERLRQKHGAAHPFFWASFVLVGAP